jgi:hypothetical protein
MNVFAQLVKSCYSPKDIAIFRFQGIGKTILYVFLLTMVSIIPSMYYLTTSIIDGVDSVKNTVKGEFPDFTIENGTLHSELNKPLTINENGFVIFFDSTGEATVKDLENIDNGIAFLQKKIAYVAGGQSQSYAYSMLEDLTITKSDLLDFLDSIDSSLPVILPIFILVNYIFSSGAKFIEISVLALLGLIIINVTNRKLNYGQLWRMSAYSVTLPTLFFTIMGALKTVVPGGIFLHWAVAYIMLFLSIKEISQPKKL